jgi:hypothetical protein
MVSPDDPRRYRSMFTPEPVEDRLWSWTPLVTLTQRVDEFCRATGLNPDDVILSRFCVSPVPLYPVSWPEGHRRWAGLRPEALWHPLFWLSPELAGRYQDVDDNAEDDDAWVMRVAVEMDARGLFDADSGSWVDVLALYGLDVDDPADVERIRRWLAGVDDPILDNIELPSPNVSDELLAVEDWSLLTAQSMMSILAHSYLVSDAEDFADAFMETQEGVAHNEPHMTGAAGGVMSNVATFASASFERYTGIDAEWWDTFADWAADNFRPLAGAAPGTEEAQKLGHLLGGAEVSEAIERLVHLANLVPPPDPKETT